MKKLHGKNSDKTSQILVPKPEGEELPKWKGYLLLVGILFIAGVLGVGIFFLTQKRPSSLNTGEAPEDLSGFPLGNGSKEKISFDENEEELSLKRKIDQYRDMLERASTREEVLESVRGLMGLKKKKAWEILKLKILNRTFQNKAYQLDFTGRMDANNRPELVPSHRRLLQIILSMMEETNTNEARDILLTILDTKVFYQPENTYRYSLHLATLLSISRLPYHSSRAFNVFQRILRNPGTHRYAQAEQQWALAALKNLKTRDAYREIKDFILEEDRSFQSALLGIQTLIETNEKGDIETLEEIARHCKNPKIRSICYKALSGIPGPYDEFGIRLTANREKAPLDFLKKIYQFLKDRLREERDPKGLSTLRRSLRRISLIIDQKLTKEKK